MLLSLFSFIVFTPLCRSHLLLQKTNGPGDCAPGPLAFLVSILLFMISVMLILLQSTIEFFCSFYIPHHPQILTARLLLKYYSTFYIHLNIYTFLKFDEALTSNSFIPSTISMSEPSMLSLFHIYRKFSCKKDIRMNLTLKF